MRLYGVKMSKILTRCLILTMLLCLQIKGCTQQAFYHGRTPERPNFSWKIKETEHFVVMHKDRYFDPEPALKDIIAKFDIQPLISGIKIKLFIDDSSGYTIVGAKTIYACDERVFRHELTHVLFLQLNRNAPTSLAEGIAIYAGAPEQLSVAAMDVKELIAAENDFRKVYKRSSVRSVLGMQVNRSTERELYSRGFYFVNSIISKKGVEAFKEFYKKCRSMENLQKAWDEVYGKQVL